MITIKKVQSSLSSLSLNRLVFYLENFKCIIREWSTWQRLCWGIYRLPYWESSLLYGKTKWCNLLCGVEKENYLGTWNARCFMETWVAIMGKSFCELPLLFSTQTSEYEELQSTYMATFLLNSFLCYSAVILSCVAICAIRKTTSLPKTLKTLLLSLAVSDGGVGLLGQPFYISLLVMWSQQNDPGCNTHKALLMPSQVCFV